MGHAFEAIWGTVLRLQLSIGGVLRVGSADSSSNSVRFWGFGALFCVFGRFFGPFAFSSKVMDFDPFSLKEGEVKSQI